METECTRILWVIINVTLVCGLCSDGVITGAHTIPRIWYKFRGIDWSMWVMKQLDIFTALYTCGYGSSIISWTQKEGFYDVVMAA